MTSGPDPAALCEEILAEGRRRAEVLLAEARREGEALLARAAAEGEALRRAARAEAMARVARRREAALAALPVARARARAARVEALLEGVRAEAGRALAARCGPELREDVAALAAEALARMAGEDLVLELPAGDAAALGPGLPEEIVRRAGRPGVRLSLRAEAALAGPGFLLRDAEGRQAWDGRLAARLDRLWPALRVRLAAGIGLTSGAGGGA